MPSVNGKLHGVAQWRAADGNLVFVEQYRSDILVGEKIQYYPSGRPYALYAFKDGKANCRSVTFYPDGTIARAVDFTNGAPTGLYINYHRNGQIKDLFHQVNGDNQGTSLHYLPNGDSFAQQTWRDGAVQRKHTIQEISPAELQLYNQSGIANLGELWNAAVEAESASSPSLKATPTTRQIDSVRLLRIKGPSRRDVYGIPGGGIIGKVEAGSTLKVAEIQQLDETTWYRVEFVSGNMYALGRPPRELRQGWVIDLAVEVINADP